LRIAV